MINSEGKFYLTHSTKETILSRPLSVETQMELYFFRNETIINYILHSGEKK